MRETRDIVPDPQPLAGAAADPVSEMRVGEISSSSKTDGDSSKETEPFRPSRSSWRTFKRHKTAMIGLWVLIVLYLMAIFCGFIAPYHYDNRQNELLWSPRTQLHWSDQNTGFSIRPFIYPIRSYFDENLAIRQAEDQTQRCYLRFFMRGDTYYFMGLIRSDLHLFGFDSITAGTAGGDEQYFTRYYLLGSDGAGRDIFSRICYGSQISMTIGLIGTIVVLIIGLSLGGASGYFGGRIDDVMQRSTEMVMLLPGFYLLLMLRYMFPATMDSVRVYFIVVLILALVGWPGLARVIRGMVLSIRQQDFILAARAMGIPTRRIIARHVIPNTFGYVIVAATLSIPGYILSESALSILGLGIMEPTPSWGNMLNKAMDIGELDQHPWVLWPGVFIFLAVMSFNLVGDGLRDALDPRRLKT